MQVQALGQEDPWRRAWQPTSVILPGKFHGHRSLAGYGPWDRKELDTTKATEPTLQVWRIKKESIEIDTNE